MAENKKFTKLINSDGTKQAVALDKVSFDDQTKKLTLYSSVDNSIKEETTIPASEVDTTLSKSGLAADAKVTGNAVKDVVKVGGTASSFTGIIVGTQEEEVELVEQKDFDAEIAKLNAKVGTPLVANTASAMVNTNKIYVYTGNESGYVNGNWYFYNGTNWESGGVYNAVAVQTDKTLIQENVPADAKKTGDEIEELKNTLTAINGSQIKTNEIDYSLITITQDKKIAGYDASTYQPILADAQGSTVAEFPKSYVEKFGIIKIPRCTISKQWFILYGSSSANNYINTATAKNGFLDLSNAEYGLINCANMASDKTMLAIAFDGRVDITSESLFSDFFELSDTVKENQRGITASVNMFESIGAIGDSYTAGSTNNSGGTWQDYRNLSWVATMGKRSGTSWKNYGHGGATTKSYLATTEFASALSDAPCDCYFFALGQNDGNQALTIGTVADIHDADYTQNADTFYGNYGKIIQQIKDHAPTARLIMVTGWVQGATWTAYDEAIRNIAEHYGIPVIEPFDDYLFSSAFYTNYRHGGHPTAMIYSSMGIAMERLFSKCVVNNPQYFQFSTIG